MKKLMWSMLVTSIELYLMKKALDFINSKMNGSNTRPEPLSVRHKKG